MESKHDRSCARAVARQVRRGRPRFLHAADFDLAGADAERALRRLVDNGELLRICDGLYWRGRVTLLGISYPAEDTLIDELVGGRTYGWAGVSAASRLGLSAQVPKRTQIAVDGDTAHASATLAFIDRSERTGARHRPAAGTARSSEAHPNAHGLNAHGLDARCLNRPARPGAHSPAPAAEPSQQA